MHRIGVSTVAFGNKDEILEFYSKTGVRMEYGVNLLQQDVEFLLKNHVPCMSVHVPSPTRSYFPNFATSDTMVYEKSMDILKESMDTLSKCGGKTIVIHPGYATDRLIPSNYAKRKPVIENAMKAEGEYIIDKNGAVTGKSYILSKKYKEHFNIFAENVDKIGKFVEDRDFSLAVENLNPRLFYILQTPDEIENLANNTKNTHLCLDIAHLFISCFANKFDYLEGVKKILNTGKVIHFHLSNNPSKLGLYDDAHDHITNGNISFPTLIPLLKQIDATFMLEVKYNPLSDIAYLKSILSQPRP